MSDANEKEKVVISPNFLQHWFVCDFQKCADVKELAETLKYINHHGYDLITVTQDATGVYTVFFKRRACG